MENISTAHLAADNIFFRFSIRLMPLTVSFVEGHSLPPSDRKSLNGSTISIAVFCEELIFHIVTYLLLLPLVAFRINWAISFGCDTYDAWEELSDRVVAFIRCAKRC